MIRLSLVQSGPRFPGPIQAVTTAGLVAIEFRRMSVADFLVQAGLDVATRGDPEFGPHAGPIQFGFALFEHDALSGHRGVVWIDDFEVMISGPDSASFPWRDGEFPATHWTSFTVELAPGEVTDRMQTEFSGGHPGKCLRVDKELDDGANVLKACVPQPVCYDPRTQGALESIDLFFKARMPPESFAKNPSPGIGPILVQDGTVYFMGGTAASYTPLNEGWLTFRFVGLKPSSFAGFRSSRGRDPTLWRADFSTHGGPIRVGIGVAQNTAYRAADSKGFCETLWIGNVAIAVTRAPLPAGEGGTARR